MSRGRLFLLATLAGSAAALGHAPFGMWPLSLLGFASLAWLVARSVHPALVGWSGGLGYFAVALHWIVEPFLVDAATHGWMAPFALVLLAGGLALFWGLAGFVSAQLAGNRAIAWAIGLSGAEMLRGHVLTGFPWALPAYIWADVDIRLLAALFGSYGLTLVTLVMTSLAVMDAKRPNARTAVLVIAGSLAMIGASWILSGETQLSGKSVRLIQPNAPQNEKWDPDKAHRFVDRALELTASPKEDLDLVVWPETAIPYPLDLAGPTFSRMAVASDGIPVFTGLNRRTVDGEWFNSSALIDGSGQVTASYDKVHLVPFGEYIPFKIDFIRALAASTGYGFSPGAGVRMIDTPLGKTVPLICYEAIFPGHAAGLEGRKGYLLQITNDAWFGTFSGPYQHLDQARFRAVEQGLPLIRAANTGVSAVVDPRGEVHGSLPLGESGYLDAAMPLALPPTPYSRTGDLPLAIVLFGVIASLFVARRSNAIANPPTSS